MDRVIRVDLVGVRAKDGERFVNGSDGDARQSVFIGNLDFMSKEEDLRAFFEAILVTERGNPHGKKNWVTRVRIVRDRETQMGKGFAYVQFAVSLVF